MLFFSSSPRHHLILARIPGSAGLNLKNQPQEYPTLIDSADRVKYKHIRAAFGQRWAFARGGYPAYGQPTIAFFFNLTKFIGKIYNLIYNSSLLRYYGTCPEAIYLR
jgi:hypothetical protein